MGLSFGFPLVPLTPPIVPSGGSNTGGIFGGGTWNNILQAIGIGSSVLGSILNRPKGLSKEQDAMLNQLLSTLSAQANAPISIDPAARNALFEQIAMSGKGAKNRITNDFASRGLSGSGLQGEEFGRVDRTMQQGQVAATTELLRDAQNRRTQAQNQLQSVLFGVPSLQGASASGTALSSIGETLGFLLTLNALGRRP